VRQTARILERPAQRELDLGVHAAQFVGRPPLQGFVQRRVEA
jgi:hypothetical protein